MISLQGTLSRTSIARNLKLAKTFGGCMAVAFQISSIHGRPAPGMRLEILLSVTETQGIQSELLAVSGEIWYRDILLCPGFQHWQSRNNIGDFCYMRKEFQRVSVHANAQILPESIALIESSRGEGDVTLDLRLHFQWRQLDLKGAEPPYNLNTLSESTSIPHIFPRSEWIKLLGDLKWSEVQFLEIPAEAFHGNAEASDFQDLLDKANHAIRTANYDAALMCLRKATEAASNPSNQGQGFNRTGIAQLIDQAFPGDNKRQKQLDDYLRSLREILQDGPHYRPGFTVSRQHALFAFSATASFFSMLAQCIRAQIIP